MYSICFAQGHYVLLNQMLEDPDYPHVSKLESYVDESQLSNICDVTSECTHHSLGMCKFYMSVFTFAASSVITTGPLYRFNEEKTLKWVQKKVQNIYVQRRVEAL